MKNQRSFKNILHLCCILISGMFISCHIDHYYYTDVNKPGNNCSWNVTTNGDTVYTFYVGEFSVIDDFQPEVQSSINAKHNGKVEYWITPTKDNIQSDWQTLAENYNVKLTPEAKKELNKLLAILKKGRIVNTGSGYAYENGKALSSQEIDDAIKYGILVPAYNGLKNAQMHTSYVPVQIR